MNSTSVTAVFGSEPPPKSECPAPAAAPVSEASGLAGVGPKVVDTLDPAQCNDRVDQNIDTAVKAAVNLVLPRLSSQSRPRLPRGSEFSAIAVLIAAMPPPHVARDLVLCEYSGSVATRVAATGPLCWPSTRVRLSTTRKKQAFCSIKATSKMSRCCVRGDVPSAFRLANTKRALQRLS